MRSLEARLSERVRIHRIVGLLWVIVVFCCVFPLGDYVPVSDGERVHHLALLGYLLPTPVLDNPVFHHLSWLLVWIGGLLWLARMALPWSPIVTVLGTLGVFSFSIDHMIYARHQAFVPTMVMILLCLWYILDFRAIQRADAAGELWTTALVPRWVELLAIGYLGWTYTLAGIEKLLTSGVGWASGEGLQIWMASLGNGGSVAAFIGSSPRLALLCQSAVLIVEVTAVLGLLWPKSRLWYGLALISFHLMVDWTIGLGFYGNQGVLLALCLPWKGERSTERS